MTTTKVVYLLHFVNGSGETARYKHAGHYMGSTSRDDLALRIDEHRSGRGARLTAAAAKSGLDFEVVRTWRGSRQTERKLKESPRGSKHLPSLCPRCYIERRSCKGPTPSFVRSYTLRGVRAGGVVQDTLSKI